MRISRRTVAFILCTSLLLALCLSSACALHAAGHDCCGEGCAVCLFIAQNSEALRLLAAAILLLLALMRVLSGNLVRRNLQAALPHSHATLVALRIRLND